MRLLDTRTGRFIPPSGNEIHRRYAILSHVWAREGQTGYPEQTYQDIKTLQQAFPQGEIILHKLSDKLRRFCEFARNEGHKYVWVDTCCINKADQNELQEAINLMFRWYQEATVCYAFLYDVKRGSTDQLREEIPRSVWFTRAWTLQELLAPRHVTFVSSDWRIIGDKESLSRYIEIVTGIDATVLRLDALLQDIPVARRMGWAARRKATKLEDEAYALMGIFGVKMVVNYGEERTAFSRLQEEIWKSCHNDLSILAWGAVVPPDGLHTHPRHAPYVLRLPSPQASLVRSVERLHVSSSTSYHRQVSYPDTISRGTFIADAYALAYSPEAFVVWASKRLDSEPLLSLSNCELDSSSFNANIPIATIQFSPSHHLNPTHVALLPFHDSSHNQLALLLREVEASQSIYVIGGITHDTAPTPHDPHRLAVNTPDKYVRLMYIPRAQLVDSQGRSLFVNERISIPSQTPASILESVSSGITYEHHICAPQQIPFRVCVPRSVLNRLRDLGYTVLGPLNENSDIGLGRRFLSEYHSSSGVVISRGSTMSVEIQVGRCDCGFGRADGTLGILVMSSTVEGPDVQTRFIFGRHGADHPIHVRSWPSSRDIPTKNIVLTSRRNRNDHLRLRIFLDIDRESPDIRTYLLNISFSSPSFQATSPRCS